MPPKKPLVDADELLSLIYQAPLEDPPWRSFLVALRGRMSCDAAALSLKPSGIGSAPKTVWSRSDGVSESELRSSVAEVARRGQINPVSTALKRSGDIITLHEAVRSADLEKNLYYQRVMQPYGFEYQLGIHIAEPGGWKSNLGIFNGKRRGPFGVADKKFFRALQPHLERSLQLYARIKRNESEKKIYEETFDRLTIGTFVLDGKGNIIDLNKVGHHLTRSGHPVSIKDNRLVLSRRDDNARLQALIKSALVAHDLGIEPFVDALRLEGQDGASLGVLVRGVASGDQYESDVSPSAIVYIRDANPQETQIERFAGELFGLTSSESRLVALLANGLALSDAAARLGVTESTVRSHMKRIFGKTGVTRQAELVRLVLRSVAILG